MMTQSPALNLDAMRPQGVFDSAYSEPERINPLERLVGQFLGVGGGAGNRIEFISQVLQISRKLSNCWFVFVVIKIFRFHFKNMPPVKFGFMGGVAGRAPDTRGLHLTLAPVTGAINKMALRCTTERRP